MNALDTVLWQLECINMANYCGMGWDASIESKIEHMSLPKQKYLNDYSQDFYHQNFFMVLFYFILF